VQANKHISSLLFLLLTLLPYLFFMTALLQQQWLKHTAKERMKQSRLQTIKVNEDDITWIHYPHELVINNQLFDVAALTHADGKLIIKGMFDVAEMQWEDELEKATKEKATQNNIGLEDLFQVFNSTGHGAENAVAQKTFPVFHLRLNEYSMQQWSPHVPSPPPQFGSFS
jgi:hypothetical protein